MFEEIERLEGFEPFETLKKTFIAEATEYFETWAAPIKFHHLTRSCLGPMSRLKGQKMPFKELARYLKSKGLIELHKSPDNRTYIFPLNHGLAPHELHAVMGDLERRMDR